MNSAPNTPQPPISEAALVETFRRLADSHPRVRIGIGDDAAMIDVPEGAVLMTADMLLDGVHFDTREHDWGRIGRKAINCSLSDCAAMAATPLAATVSLAVNDHMDAAAIVALFEGMAAAAERFDCAIVGGDLTRWPHPLAIDVAMLARPHTTRGPVRRDGAAVGDAVAVTGALGGSRAGRHLDFTPRINEAIQLADGLGEKLHAMMDISDGLSIDLHRLCTASGVGAMVAQSALESVASADSRRLAAEDGRSVLDHVLNDGEDFELLFVVETADGLKTLENVTIVGEIAEHGVVMQTADGGLIDIKPGGFDHFSNSR